jgi:tRNA(Ile)-lysidine synthetase-like protein
MSLSAAVRLLLPHRLLPTVLLVLAAVLPAAVHAEDPVAVLVTGPLSAKVGDRVAFEVELVNRSGRPLEKLRVVDYFDKGFHHEASASPIEQTGTIDLAAGTSRRLTLDFLLDEPGRQCHRVEILDQSHTFVGGATSCVQVVGSPIAAAPLATPLPTTSAPVAAPVNSYPATTYPTAPTLPAAPLAAGPLVPPPVSSPAISLPPIAAPFASPPAAAMPALPPAQSFSPPPALPAASSLSASTALPATPSLELDMVGPAEVVPGSVSEFVATVRNTGSVASGATTLEFGWDDAFTPLEASEGYKLASSKVSWDLPSLEPGGQLRRHRGSLCWVPDDAVAPEREPPPAACLMDLSRPGRFPQPDAAGVWHVSRARSGGLAAADLQAVQGRARQGGERFRLRPDAPSRSLKQQFQAAGVPPWQRQAPLLVHADGRLLFVPGLGVEGRSQAPEGTAQLRLRWEPAAPPATGQRQRPG